MTSRRIRLPLLAVTLVVLVAGAATAEDPLPTPPREQWYASNDDGHFSDGTYVRVDEACLELPEGERASCSLAAFRARSFVVVALVDTGVNPYHADFRAPGFTHHPSTYIEGYPADARSLEVSLDVADEEGYVSAVQADLAAWLASPLEQLHWIPGTRIVGAIKVAEGGVGAGRRRDHPVLDDQGHGTGVASVAAGRFHGANPEALIVVVEGLGPDSLAWAASQPWIDVVSNSWGPIANVPIGDASAARDGVARGQSMLFAAGNGTIRSARKQLPDGVGLPCSCPVPDVSPSLTNPYGGPSWVLTVGAVSPVNGQAHSWHSIPVDVSSFGSKWRAASIDGVHATDGRDFGGTSCATPITAGVLSAIVQRAREVLGDTGEGQRPGGAVAVGAPVPDSPFLQDGVLTREEAELILLHTAFPVPPDRDLLLGDHVVHPTTPAYPLYLGYGVVDRGSKARALRVLLGEEPLPERENVEQQQAPFDAVRDAVWGPL